MSDELQKHLDSGRYGSPKLHPDEQRAYLGTFRERCYLKMTIPQMKDPVWTDIFFDHLNDFTGINCLLNDHVPQNIQAIYIQRLNAQKVPFRIVSYEGTVDQKTAGLLIVTDHAVDVDIIDIDQKYPFPKVTTPTTEKQPFWKKWF